jgi:hypothetical protein
MIKHLDAVAVFYNSGFLIDRGDAVAQIGLNAGDIGNLKHVAAAATTAGRQQQQKEKWDTEERMMDDAFHSLALNITRAILRRRGHLRGNEAEVT